MSERQGLVDLLTRIGDDRAIVQSIHQTATGSKRKKSGGTEVSFWTDQITPDDLMRPSGKIGIVVWLDRSDVEAALAAFRNDHGLTSRSTGGGEQTHDDSHDRPARGTGDRPAPDISRHPSPTRAANRWMPYASS